MISILLPSRGRPWNVHRLVDSALIHADLPNNIEFIIYVDDDDHSYENEVYPDQVRFYATERTILSKYWNMAHDKATGPIYMLCGDDIVFHTQGWDHLVRWEFDKYSDKIVLVYGDDGDPNKEKTHATHPFIHRDWVKAVGYFVPPYFSSDFVDTWLNELADGIGRKVKIPILTEHMHPAFGKAEIDLTHAERYVRHWKDNTPELYASKAKERLADIEKLKGVMQ